MPIDTHVHLNDPRLFRRLDAVLDRAREAGVSEMIVVGMDLSSSEIAVRLAQEHAGLWATVGVHPHYAESVTAETMAQLRELAQAPRVVAIGETGLDFYRDLSPREAQFDALRRHFDLAAELNLPVICHCREAEASILEVLAEWSHLTRVWHSFDGTPEQAQLATDLGAMLGVSGIVTYPHTPERRETVAAMPLAGMLLETDAPYLTPYPKEGKRPKDNEPAYIPVIGECVAEIKGESTEAIFTVTTENARRIFSLL